MVGSHEGSIAEPLTAAAGPAGAALLHLLERPFLCCLHLLQASLRRLRAQAVAPEAWPHADPRHPALTVVLPTMLLQKPLCRRLRLELQHPHIKPQPPHTRLDFDVGPKAHQENSRLRWERGLLLL
jgi:hypothetical protein